MPWFPEPSTVMTDIQPCAVDHPHVPFYEVIRDMSPEGMLALWADDQPVLDEPRSGHIEGVDAFTRWTAQMREW